MNEPDYRPGDVDLLDVFVTIAESWRLLVLVPLAVGAITAIGVMSTKPEYVSRAVADIDWRADTIKQHSTLIPVIQKTGILSTFGPEMDAAVSRVSRRIEVDKVSNGVTSVSAKFHSPQMAKDVAGAILAELQLQSQPKGSEREDLEAELNSVTEAIKTLRNSAHALQASSEGTATEQEGRARALAILLNEAVTKEKRVREIEKEIRAIGAENVILPPTLPDKAEPKHVAAFSVIASVASGLFLLAVIFIRDSMRRVEATPSGAEKIKRLRAALKLSRTKGDRQ